MNRTQWTTLLALTLATLAGCTAPPQGVGSGAASSGAGTSSSSTTGTSASSGTSGTTAVAAASPVNYDPAKDPLVNPDVIFKPFPKDAPTQADEDDTLILNMSGNPTSLNPLFWSSQQDDQAQSPIYDGLITMDAKMNWKVNPTTVASFEEAPDHLSSVIHLKPGLKWQDGEPFTAEDVAWTWHTIMNDAVPIPAIRTGTDQLADVQALDPLAVKFVYKEVMATNKWNIAFPVIPKHIYDNPAEIAKDPTLSTSEYFNRYNRGGVVGNGPYKLVSWKPNEELVYERWDDYPGPKAHFKRLIYKINPDDNTTLLLFDKGSIDFIDRLRAQQFATQTNDKDFSEHGWKAMGTEWSFSFIGWNMNGSNPFFNDKQVRIAMAHAINIPRIISTVLYNLSTQAHGIYHPDSWMYNPDIELLDYDLDKASSMLDEAGWKVSTDDGWRYKNVNGQPVRFSFELMIPQGATSSQQIAQIYAADLKKIGVEMKTHVLEWATFQERTHAHKFEAAIQGWGTGSDPDGGWNIWRSEEANGGRNYGCYSNPRVDELFAEGRREMDHAKRQKIYQEIDKIIYDDQPYLFLTNPRTLSAVAKRLRGFQFSPTGLTGFDPGMSGWWVPSGMALRE